MTTDYETPQTEIRTGVSYTHTFDPAGHVCPMHYRCTMTIHRPPERPAAELVREFVGRFCDDPDPGATQVLRNEDGTLLLLIRPRGSSRTLRVTATVTEAKEL